MSRKPVSDNCILVKMPDSRTFFTYETNYPCLIEFGRKFSAEISVVHAPQAQVVELDELVRQFCSQEQIPTPEYEVVCQLLSPNDVNPLDQLTKTEQIAIYIRNELLKGSTIRYPDLVSKWEDVNPYTIRHHLTKVRHELIKNGHDVIREKPGQYRLRKKDLSDSIPLAWMSH